MLQRLLWAALICATPALAGGAQAHDIYSGVRNHAGTLCCGGEDCRAVSFRVVQGGYQLFDDTGWAVVLPQERVTPALVPGSPPEAEAHWCGRALNERDDDPVDLRNRWHTFCAFIRPGGA